MLVAYASHSSHACVTTRINLDPIRRAPDPPPSLSASKIHPFHVAQVPNVEFPISVARRIDGKGIAGNPTETVLNSYKCPCAALGASLREDIRYEEKRNNNGPTHSIQPFIDIYDSSDPRPVL